MDIGGGHRWVDRIRLDERKLLILDLDETLVYATEEPLEREPDFRVFEYHVYKRPHLEGFLAFCLQTFRVAVWTSSGSLYAQEVISRIFLVNAQLEFVWTARRCTTRFDPDTRKWYTLKLLKKVRRRGYDLTQVIVVDDTARKHKKNYGNLVPVATYTGDVKDDELELLTGYLAELAKVPNVRVVEKRFWRYQVSDQTSSHTTSNQAL
jgi:RNA polymerase II subunit A small phosphatase-like protein